MTEKTYMIHKTDESQVNYEANTELNKELGVVAYSLWVRDGDTENILLSQSQQPSFLSTDVNYSHNSSSDTVSKELIECIAQMRDEDTNGGFGGVDEDLWEEMEKIERLIYNLILENLANGHTSREVFDFIIWCESYEN